MRDRGAAQPRGVWGARRLHSLAVLAVVLPALVGCADVASDAGPTLEQTLRDRDRAAADAHSASLDRSAAFLREKWGPVALPDEPISRWVIASDWGPAMARCLSDAGFPGVAPADGGERLDFSGVRVSEPRELFEIDVASYRCQSLYPVRGWFDDDVRDIEAPWALTYTRALVVPCLLAAGHLVPPTPAEADFRATWRTESAFDAYALVGDGASGRARALAQCPSAETVLDGAPQ